MKNNNLFYNGLGMPLDGIRRKAFNEFNELIYQGNIVVESVDDCFCRHTNFQKLSRFDRYGLPFGTQICRNCGLISQTIKMCEESLDIFYNQIYWPLNMDTYNPEKYYTTSTSIKDFIDFIHEHIDFNQNISIAEVGCSNGIRLEHLSNYLKQDFNVEMFGCDFSERVLSLAKDKGIKIFNGGMEKLLGNAPYDILILSHVFEHFIDLKDALHLIDQLTHDDSLVYVEVPGVIDLVNKKEYMYDYQDYTVLAHIHNFSLATLSNVFKTQGFFLEKGVDFVRAIFRKKVKIIQNTSEQPYLEIMEALNIANKRNQKLLFMINHPIRKYIKGIYKALLGKS